MPRFYYNYVELIDDSWTYAVFDNRFGSEEEIARCDRRDDAERIVDALNAPKLAGVFG